MVERSTVALKVRSLPCTSLSRRYRKKKQFCDVLSFQKYHKLQMMMIQDKQQKKIEKLKEDLIKTEETINIENQKVLNDQVDENSDKEEHDNSVEDEFCDEEESFSDEYADEEEFESSISSSSEYLSEIESEMEVGEYWDDDEHFAPDQYETETELETREIDDEKHLHCNDEEQIKDFEHEQGRQQFVTNLHANRLVDYVSTDDEIPLFDDSDIENNGNEYSENLNEASNVQETLDGTINIENREGSTPPVDDFDVEAVMAMQFRDTRLESHIREHSLNLIPREATRNDGNCWYDAIADQIVLHEVPDKPTNHIDLRTAVCNALPKLPQAKDWVQNIFGGEESFSDFIEEHKKPGVWTDGLGIMCQATSLYVGRNIHIVGTANIGQGFAFTKLESVEEANSFPPFTVGYYQDKHYQSLQEDPRLQGKVMEQNRDVLRSSDEVRNIIDKFDEEKLLEESVFESDSDYEGLYPSDLDIDCFDNNLISSDDSVCEMLEKVDKIRRKDDTVVDASAGKPSYGKSRNLLDRLC